MFQRIVYEDWQMIFPIVALLVATLVYVCAALRTSAMKPKEAERLARLPLDHE